MERGLLEQKLEVGEAGLQDSAGPLRGQGQLLMARTAFPAKSPPDSAGPREQLGGEGVNQGLCEERTGLCV